MRRSDLDNRYRGSAPSFTPPSNPSRTGVTRPGFVYVLNTTSTSGGFPVVKIGMTTRTPEKRVKELSRGGPTAMKLEGFVTSRDARALERWAHEEFGPRKIVAGGGTEYFAVEAEEVLTWLKSAAPRFEIASARQAAWAEFCASRPYRERARLQLLPLWMGGTALGLTLLFWHSNVWVVVLALPLGALAGGCMVWLPFGHLHSRLKVRCAELMTQLEEKYHLPSGGVRAPGP